MPKEIFDPAEFSKLSENASECRVKKLGDTTKIKLRTKRYLYTISLEASEAEELLKNIKCPKVEL